MIEDVYFGATNQAGEDNRNDPLLGDLHGDRVSTRSPGKWWRHSPDSGH